MINTQNPSAITAWDIGGAHLKVARCSAEGEVLAAIELPCALWQGIETLQQAIQQAAQMLHNTTDQHYLTMTGELADIFADRQSGVRDILSCVQKCLPDQTLVVFSQQGFLTVDEAKQRWQSVASMNWLASVQWLALAHKDALFIDIGSTTTDIICIENAQPQLTATDDYGRLASGELRYTGVIRTPVMAVSSQAFFQGKWLTVAAEHFATMADCWRLVKQLEADALHDNSADGQGWQIIDCERRLARMLGTDRDQGNTCQWQQLATWFTEQQTQQITNSCLQVLSAHSLPDKAPIIGAGVGRFVAQQIAIRLHRPYIDFSMNLPCPISTITANYAPAVALALLAHRQLA
jgi:probable H4MPT-linked C1 transfer pathway protein